MENSPNSSRIVLEEKAQAALSSMLETLKSEGEFLKISSSKLASWIVVSFFEEHFLKVKARILQDHFNSREYLRSIADGINNSEDVEKILSNALQQLKRRKGSPSISMHQKGDK